MHQAALAGWRTILRDIDIVPRLSFHLEKSHGAFLDPKDRMIDQRVRPRHLEAELHDGRSASRNQGRLDTSRR